MKTFCVLILMIAGLASCKQSRRPVAVIFDSDIAPDYDDVGALAVLHALADNGEATILATMSSNAFETTGPTLSVINTNYNRHDIPIGVVNGDKPSFSCPRRWAEGIIAKYPHKIRSNRDAWDALKLYRKILAEQPDSSVTIVTVGTLTNISHLLNSSPDENSALDGRQLVIKKVRRLVSMAGAIDSNGMGGYESNILGDIAAAQNVFHNWPTAITISGFEIGVTIFTGMELIRDSTLKNSAVKDAYQISISHDGSTQGRYSWDQTAVLVAVRGIKPYFNSRKLDLKIKDDGKDTVVAGTRLTYITPKMDPQQLAKVIEELMMQQPKAN